MQSRVHQYRTLLEFRRENYIGVGQFEQSDTGIALRVGECEELRVDWWHAQ